MNKNLAKIILLLSMIILISGLLAPRTAFSSPAPSTNSTVEPGSMTKACRALVYKSGSQAVNLDGFTGVNHQVTGVDDAVVQDAMNNILDAGRAFQEKVCLIGSFTFTTVVQIPSYTYVQLDGSILAGAGFVTVFPNQGPLSLSGVKNVTISGPGLIQMPASATALALGLFESNNVVVQYITFDGQGLNNGKGAIVWVEANGADVSDISFRFNTFQNSIQDGLQFHSYSTNTMQRIRVFHNVFTNLYRASTAYAEGTSTFKDLAYEFNLSQNVGGFAGGTQYLHYVFQRTSLTSTFNKILFSTNIIDGKMTSIPYPGGGVAAYSVGDLNIGNNVIDMGNSVLVAGASAGPAFALGRTTSPAQYVFVHDNVVRKVDAFIDFDSTFDAIITNNYVENICVASTTMGYGYHQDIIWSGNQIKNPASCRDAGIGNRAFIFLQNGVIGSPVSINLPNSTSMTLATGSFQAIRESFQNNQYRDEQNNVLYTLQENTGGSSLQRMDNTTILTNLFYSKAALTTSLVSSNFTSSGNIGLNPFNRITNFIGKGTIGPIGTTATVVASTTYTVSGANIGNFTTSGGTGVVLTIKDSAGNCLICGAATINNLQLVIGETISFGAFSVAPTVKVWCN